MLSLEPHESMRMRVMHAIPPAPQDPLALPTPLDTSTRPAPLDPTSSHFPGPQQPELASAVWPGPYPGVGTASTPGSESVRAPTLGSESATTSIPRPESATASTPGSAFGSAPRADPDPGSAPAGASECGSAPAGASEFGRASLAGCYALLEVEEGNLGQAEALREPIGDLVQRLGGRYHGARTFKSGSVATLP